MIKPNHPTEPFATLTATTLALDLGTSTGYAVGIQGAEAASLMHTAVAGTWELLTEAEAKQQRQCGLERLGDARYYRLRDRVLDLCRIHKVTRVVFEDVTFSHSTFQTQLWGSLRAALWETRDRLGIELQAVPVPTLKSFACSKPHATKAEMETALRNWVQNARGTYIPGDDNEVDARWLLCYTLAVDAQTRNWAFGWQLKNERKIEARTLGAKRRLEKSKRIKALRADGLKRLDSLVREIGERLTVQAGRKAVMELWRNKRHTLDLKSHVIVGSVLKGRGLRWEIS